MAEAANRRLTRAITFIALIGAGTTGWWVENTREPIWSDWRVKSNRGKRR